ncbi:transporter substrate-binding domain-containing protein [Collinsella sp. zg1085]|uniref:transporter substrate-binding domain-containing protein n=1 Tax=Collinsella sp. zg1085 TaxID=2844380 RepID=UPI001C0C09EB|nr:transporter substrate-binding domain-containing protein [Collinsella sp. zg1085]QWT17815.1 transporter substrate-binding domain-containing protein [Collinsella sp. zg1085]
MKQFSKPMSRRVFVRAGLAASATTIAALLAGCQRPSNATSGQNGSAAQGADPSEAVLAKKQLRIGMEAAYAPYNWQVSEESEFTIPIDNVPGAFADGYDVQIAKYLGEQMGFEPVAVKQSFSGLIDSLNNGQIDLIIAGMSATDERRQSVDFSEPYFVGSFGLFVMKGSSYENATKLSDFAGATVLGQKDTMLDDVIDEIPDVIHKTPVDSVPTVFSNLKQGTCDAVTFNTENEAGYIKQNPDFVAVKFAPGEGFKEEVPCNVGMKKGSTKLLETIDKTLAELKEDERQKLWDAVLERQPA